MRYSTELGVAILLAVGASGSSLLAQIPGNSADIQKKLTTQYTLTKITADRSDIVTAGSILVLQKDGLVMYGSTTSMPSMNVYRDGKIQASGSNILRKHLNFSLSAPAETSPAVERHFVAGEKFWLTGVTVQQDGVVLNFFSDPFNDVRYYGLLKFPFAKGSTPSPDDLAHVVGEVVTVQPGDNTADNGGGGQTGAAPAQTGAAPAQNAAAATPPAPPPAPLADIPPPPPPPDQAPTPTKVIAVGQTRAQVIATWGQPSKDIKLAAKEILVYPDMKVTFVSGKVSTVE